MPDEQSSQPDRRRREYRESVGRGRRADDPIVDLATHPAKHVTARQIAHHCEVSLQTVYKWIASRELTRVPHFTREIRVKTDNFRVFVSRLHRSS